MKLLRVASAMLLLLFSPLLIGNPADRVTQVLSHQRTYGYVSASSAIEQLITARRAQEAALPLEEQSNYHYALMRLSMDSGDEAQAVQQVEAMERLAKNDACVLCQVHALLGRTFITLRQGSVDAARPWLEQAEALLPRVADGGAREQTLALRGNLEGQDHKLNLGIEHTVQALELAESRGDAAEAVRMLGTLVWMNTDLGDFKRAVSLGEDAYKRAAEMGYRPMMARISLDLGHAHALAGDLDGQRLANERALELSSTDPGLMNIRSLSLNNLSDFYLSQPNGNARVLEYARRAEELARTHHREIHRAAPLTNIGIALARMGRVDEGIGYIREAIAVSEKLHMKEYVLGITLELVKVLEGADRYRDALAELHNASALESELTAQRRDKAVLELQEKYGSERRTVQINQLSAQNALKQAQLDAGTWRRRLWIALAAALALGGSLLLLAIGRIRKANRRLTEQSRIDPLTGVYNRRYIQKLLDREQPFVSGRHAPKESDATGLLILDLDLFKRINDTFGHNAGDAVLTATAQRLRRMLRDGDAIARWGGEEFVVVVANTSASALAAVTSKLLHALADMPVTFEQNAIMVTASIGAVSLPMVPGQDWQAALGVADAALYLAKSNGRNRAICITRVSAGAVAGLDARNLAQARSAGDIDWLEVSGSSALGDEPGNASPRDRTSTANA